MKKFLLHHRKALAVVLAICSLLAVGILCACGRTVDISDVADRVYTYEKSLSDDDANDFYMHIKEDGTFSYSEGWLSSHMSVSENCSWSLHGNILVLTERCDGGDDRVNRFEVKGDTLIFQSEGSDNFIYTRVVDGEKFILVE